MTYIDINLTATDTLDIEGKVIVIESDEDTKQSLKELNERIVSEPHTSIVQVRTPNEIFNVDASSFFYKIFENDEDNDTI